MKRIFFPATDRVHLSRQSLLLNRLSEKHEVVVSKHYKGNKRMSREALKVFSFFDKELRKKEPDLLLARGDRFEVLPIVMAAAYQGIPIAHIEGGQETGKKVIDSKVRHAISHLSDYHFVTDDHSKETLINKIGASPDTVFNVGSLDVSYAKSITPERIIEGDYILLLHHTIPEEDTKTVYEAIKDIGVKIIGIRENQDYEKSIMTEEYEPEDFIKLMYYAKVLVGNSSAICKEASILGTPCVLVGTRQDGRMYGHNVIHTDFDPQGIRQATEYQLTHDRYKPDPLYYKPDTELAITKQITKILNA